MGWDQAGFAITGKPLDDDEEAVKAIGACSFSTFAWRLGGPSPRRSVTDEVLRPLDHCNVVDMVHLNFGRYAVVVVPVGSGSEPVLSTMRW